MKKRLLFRKNHAIIMERLCRLALREDVGPIDQKEVQK